MKKGLIVLLRLNLQNLHLSNLIGLQLWQPKPILFFKTFGLFFLFLLTCMVLCSLYFQFTLKVSKSQKQNCRKKLLPKMNGQICFSILTIRNYLKLEIEISSFKWFRTVRIEKQIRPFIFGRSFFRQFCFWDLLTFSRMFSIR